MTDLSKEQVKQMAQLVGIELDEIRAETISLRLSSVLAELDEIPYEALAGVEPAPIFNVVVEGQA